MSDHTSSVFNNACLKIPRDPISQNPSPIYEQKYVSNMHNEMIKMDMTNDVNTSKSKSLESADKVILKSFIEFYDSIPEYDDINHLSNKDFYRKLENLKEKQKSFNKFMYHNNCENKSNDWMEDYKRLNIREKRFKKNFKQKNKQFNKLNSERLRREYAESTFSDRDLKPSSRRSVRIESPSDKSDSSVPHHTCTKSIANISTTSSKYYDKSNFSYNGSPWEDTSVNDFRSDSDRDIALAIRSVPNSPIKNNCGIGWKENGITIPKPFQMTVRDEENKIVEEVISKIPKPKEEKSELFRANPVPVESRVPLFNQIIAEQERRSEMVKRKSRESLKAQMRPFSFTQRDEEIQTLTKGLSKSSPSIFLEEIPIKVQQFRAKPIPKGLFSNYVYQKMHEDEFYRALQRKIRAEEMLRRSSLPPSMAKREKIKPKPIICPRSFKNLEMDSTVNSSNKSSPMLKYKETETLVNNVHGGRDFVDSPMSFKRKSEKKNAEKRLKQCYGNNRNSSGSSRNAEHYRASSAIDLLSVNKSNLAAVLRIQSAKKKMQTEMCKKLEEVKIKEESRWREKVLRKKPAWQSLVYSHEEDLAMRLQLRREEEKLRSEEHRHRMELMYGRVNRMPMLFERQDHIKQYPVTRKELIAKLNKEYKYSKFLNSSPLSLSVDLDGTDDDKQVILSKETIQSKHDEKEKCDSV
ncbi:hypothetical protein RN001_001402 [Aquatica leii]|uniref:Uncharacterized protein n=1 Tax=Aquatica leii TaxID=1421715 RepID=A0AAN7PL66_9COLE|nr:hypothetical protein RN001_001402 [Aquatica leii]